MLYPPHQNISQNLKNGYFIEVLVCISVKTDSTKLLNVHFGHTSAHYRPTESLFMPSTRQSRRRDILSLVFYIILEVYFCSSCINSIEREIRLFYIMTINSDASHMNRRWKRRDLSTCHHVLNYLMSFELTLGILPPRYPSEDNYNVPRSFSFNI